MLMQEFTAVADDDDAMTSLQVTLEIHLLNSFTAPRDQLLFQRFTFQLCPSGAVSGAFFPQAACRSGHLPVVMTWFRTPCVVTTRRCVVLRAEVATASSPLTACDGVSPSSTVATMHNYNV